MTQKKHVIYCLHLAAFFAIMLSANFSVIFAQSVYRPNVGTFSTYTNHVPSPDSDIFAPSMTSNLLARAPGNAMIPMHGQYDYTYEIVTSYAVDAPAARYADQYGGYSSGNSGLTQAPTMAQSHYSVSTQYFSWNDFSRNRNIPVKIYRPAHVTERCPVIVFSHGLGGSHEKCAYLGQAWAAQGFVSVHIRHAGVDEDVWKRKIRPIKELKDVYGRHWSGRMQANDIRFVLNRLEQLADSGSSFGQMIDMTRVGVAGYDLGGLASMLVAGQSPPDRGTHLHDHRVKAIVVMSPPVYDHAAYAPASYGSMNTPAMFFTGTEDDGWIGTTQAWQRRIPFDHMQGNDRFLVTYHGADHMIYGGHIRSSKSRDDQKYQANIAQASTMFWRAYLREEPAVQAYFRGQTLGGVSGSLGRVERRLTDYAEQYANDMMISEMY